MVTKWRDASDDSRHACNNTCTSSFFSVSSGQRYCIPNAVEDTTNDRVLRLNLDGHPLSYVNDQDMGTAWLSRTMATQEDMEEGLIVTVDLANGQYQVRYQATANMQGTPTVCIECFF